jgi:hypothetical protein
MLILTRYKNTLLTIIQESGLDPKLFTAEASTISKEQFFIIRLRNSPIFYAIRPYQRSFSSFESFGSQFAAGFPSGGSIISVQTQHLFDTFKDWLNDVVKPYLAEVITPDLWQTLQDTLSDAAPETEALHYFEPFSEEEKNQLRLSIKEFRISIVNNFNPPKEYQDTIDSHLKDFSDAIDKQNKFAFNLMAIQLVTKIAIDLALNPEQFNQLLQLFKYIFSHISHLLS